MGARKGGNASKHSVTRDKRIRIGVLKDNTALLIRTVAFWHADPCEYIRRARPQVPERQQRFDRERFRCMMGAEEYVEAAHSQMRNLSA